MSRLRTETLSCVVVVVRFGSLQLGLSIHSGRHIRKNNHGLKGWMQHAVGHVREISGQRARSRPKYHQLIINISMPNSIVASGTYWPSSPFFICLRSVFFGLFLFTVVLFQNFLFEIVIFRLFFPEVSFVQSCPVHNGPFSDSPFPELSFFSLFISGTVIFQMFPFEICSLWRLSFPKSSFSDFPLPELSSFRCYLFRTVLFQIFIFSFVLLQIFPV